MSVKQKALEQALKTLAALSCQYKVITPEGQEFGELEVQTQHKRTRTPKRPYGTFTKYLSPLMEPMQAGDVIIIPSGEFEPAELQSAVTSSACNRWGKGNYVSTVNGRAVELLRIA